jgi:hypothetical protein
MDLHVLANIRQIPMQTGGLSATTPLLETEIKGAKILNRTIDYLFVREK